jgi:asparagine synthase (glutamine-hydrolysing)
VRKEPFLHAVSLLELLFFTGERLLRDTDSVSMGVSLEVRVPLLDHRVLEVAAGLDGERRFAPLRSKQVLRDAVKRELPSSFFERPKSGFVLPIDRWTREGLKEEVGATLGDRALCESVGVDPKAIGRLWRAFQDGSPGIYWSRVWGLFILLRWCRNHRVCA